MLLLWYWLPSPVTTDIYLVLRNLHIRPPKTIGCKVKFITIEGEYFNKRTPWNSSMNLSIVTGKLFWIDCESILVNWLNSPRWGVITNFDLIEIVKKDTKITDLDVWLGKKNKVKTYLKNSVYKTIPKARKKYLKAVVNYNGPIEAPIMIDDIVGKLQIQYKDEIIEEYDLLAYENVKKVNILTRLIKSINYLIWGDV